MATIVSSADADTTKTCVYCKMPNPKLRCARCRVPICSPECHRKSWDVMLVHKSKCTDSESRDNVGVLTPDEITDRVNWLSTESSFLHEECAKLKRIAAVIREEQRTLAQRIDPASTRVPVIRSSLFSPPKTRGAASDQILIEKTKILRAMQGTLTQLNNDVITKREAWNTRRHNWDAMYPKDTRQTENLQIPPVACTLTDKEADIVHRYHSGDAQLSDPDFAEYTKIVKRSGEVPAAPSAPIKRPRQFITGPAAPSMPAARRKYTTPPTGWTDYGGIADEDLAQIPEEELVHQKQALAQDYVVISDSDTDFDVNRIEECLMPPKQAPGQRRASHDHVVPIDSDTESDTEFDVKRTDYGVVSTVPAAPSSVMAKLREWGANTRQEIPALFAMYSEFKDNPNIGDYSNARDWLGKIKQRSDVWKKLRVALATASNMATYCGHGYKAIDTLQAQIAKDSDPSQDHVGLEENVAMKWGTVCEPVVRRVSEVMMNKKIEESGLLLHPTIPWFAGSPDGLITTYPLFGPKPVTDDKTKTLLEIKVSSTNLYESVFPNWVIQTQMTMACSNTQRCIIVACKIPRPEKKTTPPLMRIFTINRDPDFIDILVRSVNNYMNNILELRKPKDKRVIAIDTENTSIIENRAIEALLRRSVEPHTGVVYPDFINKANEMLRGNKSTEVIQYPKLPYSPK